MNGRCLVFKRAVPPVVEQIHDPRNDALALLTVDGAKASAIVYSLMLTCRACGIEPLTYLRHILSELPQRASDADITDLLPFNFTKDAPD